MKVNLSVVAVNLDGEAFKDQKGEPVLISKQIGNSLFQSQDKENALATYELAKKVYYADGPLDLTTSEIEKIKSLIKSEFIAGFAGQALEIIAKAEK